MNFLPAEIKLKIASHINDDVDYYSYWQAVFNDVSDAACWMVRFEEISHWDRFYYPASGNYLKYNRGASAGSHHDLCLTYFLDYMAISESNDLLEHFATAWISVNDLRVGIIECPISESIAFVEDYCEEYFQAQSDSLIIYRKRVDNFFRNQGLLQMIGPINCAELKENLYKMVMKIVIVCNLTEPDDT